MIQLKLLLIFVCLVHLINPMVVNDIESDGSDLTKIIDQNEHTQPQHHIRHNAHHHRHHHSTKTHHNAKSNAKAHHSTVEHHNNIEMDNNGSHSQPNMWQILGQTIKTDDTNHFDGQQMFDKMQHHHQHQQQHEEHQQHQQHEQQQNQNQNQNEQTANCPKCRNQPELRVTEKEFTKLRIEYVKNQILKKLQMTERPKVSAAHLPRPIAEGSMILDDDEEQQQNQAFEQFYGKTTQKIIFLELDNEKCQGVENFGSYMCFTFRIPDDMDHRDVDAAELWVYRQPDSNANEAQSFLISEIEEWGSKKINKPFAIHYANSSEGWGKIDFTWSIQNWIKYQNLYHIIDISCNTCEKHPTLDLFSLDYGYRPFIVVNTTSSQTIKRQRRNINCSPGISECCRDKLYISFAEIGWNDWIIHPAGYDAYFCRGSCASTATITSDASYYNLVVRKMIHSKNNSAHNREKSLELVPCCTATQFSSLQLLYMESNTTVTRKTLPNMVVEACGCM